MQNDLWPSGLVVIRQPECVIIQLITRRECVVKTKLYFSKPGKVVLPPPMVTFIVPYVDEGGRELRL